MKNENLENPAVVGTFDKSADAEALKAFLIREGVPAEVRDETNVQKYWFFVTPQAGFHVQVPLALQEKAQAIIAQKPDLFRNAVRCPSCHSSRIQYPALTRKNMMPVLVKQIMVLFHIQKHKFYCEDCHYSWVPGHPSLRNEFPPPKTIAAKR